MSSMLNALASDNIGLACFIFLNFDDGLYPTLSLIELYFFKNELFSSNFIISFRKSSYCWSEMSGESLS